MDDIPTHLAIIMDGNGRWASQRGLPRTRGHAKGVEVVRDIARVAADRGVQCLTLFSFSSENRARPKAEVDFLFTLLERFIEADLADLHTRNVCLRVLGRRDDLPFKLKSLITHAETLTSENTGQRLQIAFNYGGREEIADAASRLAKRVVAGTLDANAITPEVMNTELLTGGLPDPDLLIRTGGEHRISNFLLWQCAYTELYFTDIYFPDFSEQDLDTALDAYKKRERRFGKLEGEA
ncbi:MAG: di-trans,poly-cis-decaprenylcistransferase [Alphaproteobacteria bacterium]|nr:di-trans,poly-cis-decaprenylcistransferase [Alphaproteobacteria bacterium]MBE8220825.1 di-trans,poly-cis-decaprenylcistransferase [Alphaproteobacteria bacterium]